MSRGEWIAPGGLPPAAMGVAGAVASAVAGWGDWPGAVLAAAMLLLGMVLAVAGGRSWQSILSRRLAECEERVRLTCRQDAETHLAGLAGFGDQVVPVWARQIETSREQTEAALLQLTERFSGIVGQLDQAIAASSATADAMQGRDEGVPAVLAGSEERLGRVVASLRDALARKDALLGEVADLVEFIEQLKNMATSVSSIAEQTNLLALNAAIEAARAGEAGRGFAVVADEVRKLSGLSGSSGKRINEVIEQVSQGISRAFETATRSNAEDAASVASAQTDIHAVLEDFRRVTDGLAESGAILRGTGTAIQAEVASSLVQLQFQDRVSQILTHVRDSVSAFPEMLRDNAARFHQDGRLRPLAIGEVLARLERSYATREEQANHGRDVSGGNGEIAFF